ncbi:LppP/LprE family lipoprotein [Nocardia africana]|uniref:LppP/LprE family lipoprotein n=1 Tax=Nocardia africana TaxID=134964 RepID=A0ABW6NGJ8_9NOCA
MTVVAQRSAAPHTPPRRLRRVCLPVLAGVVLAALTGCGDGPDNASAPASSAPSSVVSPTQIGRTTQETASPVTTSGSADCAPDLAAPEVRRAVATLPPYDAGGGLTWAWNDNPPALRGTYNRCSTLSVVVVTVQGATASSPEHALLFHRGDYVGTATPKAQAFTTIDTAAGTDDTVVLTYKTPGSCNACPDGTETTVSFHWNGSGVDTQGRPPVN